MRASLYQNIQPIHYITLYLIQEEPEDFQKAPGPFMADYKKSSRQKTSSYKDALAQIPKDFYKACSDCFIVKVEGKSVTGAWEVTTNTLGNITSNPVILSGKLEIEKTQSTNDDPLATMWITALASART